MSAIETLLRASIDYAGLFPPAGLDMHAAVANYAHYRTSPAAWALGRFIVPVGQLSELEAATTGNLLSTSTEPWRLSVLAGGDIASDLEQLGRFNERHAALGAPRFMADTFEVKATSDSAIESIMRQVPAGLQAYIEIPVNRDPSALIATIGRLGGRAKVRAGGVSQDAFPETTDLVRFIHRCVAGSVAFKATAGLHHPLTAEYRLTYAPDSPRGFMFGFLNLFLSVGFIRNGINEPEAARLLEDGAPEAFETDDTGISWRGRRLNLQELGNTRLSLTSFGSCSFTEPISELEVLHLLAPRAQRA